jgi:hypothetical protein
MFPSVLILSLRSVDFVSSVVKDLFNVD